MALETTSVGLYLTIASKLEAFELSFLTVTITIYLYFLSTRQASAESPQDPEVTFFCSFLGWWCSLWLRTSRGAKIGEHQQQQQKVWLLSLERQWRIK
mmetsp:Transcript_19188/g.33253  ORF Transcript_19188/g.33253 Transcript_19188/m.33253 type:complete len:98 (+) Transcript_19188:1113-1406(+)